MIEKPSAKVFDDATRWALFGAPFSIAIGVLSLFYLALPAIFVVLLFASLCFALSKISARTMPSRFLLFREYSLVQFAGFLFITGIFLFLITAAFGVIFWFTVAMLGVTK